MQTITNEQLFKKLTEVENLLLTQGKFMGITENSTQLWSAQDIADYFQYSYEHTKRSIISDPDFPGPVELQGRTGGKTGFRWISGDVVRFSQRKRRKKRY